MKQIHESHLGKEILLFDGTPGIVKAMTTTTYTVSIDNTEAIIPIAQISLKKSVLRLKPQLIIGNLYELQHFGDRLNGTVVRVVSYRSDKDEYFFNYVTGCGSFAPIRCFRPLTKANELVKINGHEIVCDNCSESFDHTETKLYFIRLADGIKQGTMCNDCFDVARPMFNIEPVEEVTKPSGEKEISTLDTPNIVRLNRAVSRLMTEISDIFGLQGIEKHIQVDKHTMEYTIKFNTPRPKVAHTKTEIPMDRLKSLLQNRKNRGIK